MIRSSNDETNFPHKSLLTDTLVSRIRKAITNSPSANINVFCNIKKQLSKIVQLGGFSIGLSTLSKKLSEPSEPIIISYVKELKNTGAKK